MTARPRPSRRSLREPQAHSAQHALLVVPPLRGSEGVLDVLRTPS